MKKVSFILLILVLITSCAVDGDTTYKVGDGYTLSLKGGAVVSNRSWVKVIEKNPDKDFVILNFTDIQQSATTLGIESPEIFEMMDRIVAKVKPDLITYTGDISYGCPTPVYAICSKIDSYGIPWAPVYGNHEFEDSGMSPETLSKVLQNYKHCLFANGPAKLAIDETGIEAKGNYVVNVVENNGTDFKVVKSLIFMNSGTVGIMESQVPWYEDCVDTVKKYGSDVSTAVFTHIPVDGCDDAFDYVYPKVNYSRWMYTSEDCFGICENGSWRKGDPLTEVLYDKGSTDLFVCGHYHVNCFCIKYRGIKFVYALKTGPGCYYDEALNGATKIKVSSDGDSEVEFIFSSDLD